MIARLGAAMLVTVTGAAAALAQGTATVVTSQPVVWQFLGYPFEAAVMIAGLFGCLSARFWIGAGLVIRKQHRWLIDLPVSAMTLGTTAALVIAMRPEPLTGLLLGAGLGVLGEGIFKIAEKKLAGVLGVDDDDDAGGITRAIDQLHHVPPVPGKD